MMIKAHSEQAMNSLVCVTVSAEIDWENLTINMDERFLSSDALHTLTKMFRLGEISCPNWQQESQGRSIL